MAKHRRKSSKACRKTTITFKKRRGGTVSFIGKTGASCGPRPKPKTGHLRTFKSAFKTAVRACKGKSHKRAGKHGKSAFNKCIGAKL
jgi:hypothetical protein